MIDVWFVVLSFLAGLAIGAFYFVGLWLTIRRIHQARSPALLMFASFVGRTAVAVFCFYLIVRSGQWERLLAGVGGFIVIRIILVLFWRPQRKDKESPTNAPHA